MWSISDRYITNDGYFFDSKKASALACMCVCLCLLFQTGKAQVLKWKKYTTEDGLPHNVGYDIMQDSKGYIWLGMDNGLTRFDGISFVTYSGASGLQVPHVITLSEDPGGRLWMGTHRFLVHYKKPKQDTIIAPRFFQNGYNNAEIVHLNDHKFLINDLSPHPIKKFEPLGVCEWVQEDSCFCEGYFLHSDDGNLNLIKHNGTLENFRKVRAKVENSQLKPVSVSFFQRDSGPPYLMTSIGLWTYDNDQGFHRLYPSLLPGREVAVMDTDTEGDEWIVMDGKLYQVIQGNRVETFSLPVPENQVGQMIVIRENKIVLLGTNRKDLYIWNPQDGRLTQIDGHLGIEAQISFIQKDQENNLWITTMGSGLYCIQDHEVESYSVKQGLPNSFINSIHGDGRGNTYVATTRGMVKMSDSGIQRIFPEHNEEIHDVYFDTLTQNFHFISTQGGFWGKEGDLSSYPFPMGSNRISIDDQRRQILVRVRVKDDPLSTDFILTQNGNILPEVINIKFSDIHLRNPSGKTFVWKERNSNAYWITPIRGLMRYKGGEVEYFTEKDGLPESRIYDIFQDKDGRMWFASEMGIFSFENGKMQNHAHEMGMENIPCHKLLIDGKGKFWMGTPQGLYSWDGEKSAHFDVYDGLIANDINCMYIDENEKLWLGTSGGISILDLNKLPSPTKPPVITMEKILINDQPLKDQSNISVPPNQPLSFSYTTPTYIAPRRIDYQYRLRAGDPWINTTNRSLRLADLQAGDYTFFLRAKKIHTDWGESFQLKFEIQPPWWQTPIALFVWAALILTMISIIFRLRVRHVHKKAEEKMLVDRELGELKLKALQSQLNPHFIFNALNVIQGFILENDIDSSNLYLERFSYLMRMFLESSKKNYLTLREELELLTLFIEMEQLCYEGRFAYEIFRDPQLNPESIQMPSMLIQPFVENAIHHGLLKKEGIGHLQIRFEALGREIRCLIIDDGVGRKESNKSPRRSIPGYQSRGMQIVSERLQIQNQLENSSIRIHVTDVVKEPNEVGGTQVEIIFPFRESERVF